MFIFIEYNICSRYTHYVYVVQKGVHKLSIEFIGAV